MRGAHLVAVYLEPEWCEAIFASQVRGRRARQLAEELAERGVEVPSDADGPYLPRPAGVRSDELVFVSYMYPYEAELASQTGAAPTQTEVWWHRRDYLPDILVEYEDEKVTSSRKVPVVWRHKPLNPHNWGIVPAVWITPKGTRPGATEGQSLLTPAVKSQIAGYDRAASLKDDAVALNCAPVLYTINLDLRSRRHAVERDLQGQNDPIPADAGATYHFETTGSDKQGEVGLLEMSGEGPATAEEHLKSLKGLTDQTTGVVEQDPSESEGVLSGVALQRRLEPLVATVQAYRGRVGTARVRLAQKLNQAMRVEGLLSVEFGIAVNWPPVIAQTAEDVTAAATAYTTAAGSPVMRTETAARLFGEAVELDDPEGEAQALAEEQAEALAALQQQLDDDPDDEDDEDLDDEV